MKPAGSDFDSFQLRKYWNNHFILTKESAAKNIL